MSDYSISDLEKYSGIKAHTIRIWEQRYKILKPKRTEGNTRYYDDDHLKKLLNISSLIKSGYKISEVSAMNDSEISAFIDKKIMQTAAGEELPDFYINELITSALKYDQGSFETVFSSCTTRFGIGKTYLSVVLPLLERIGLMWNQSTASPAQEHFISELIRMKLFSIIDAIPAKSESHQTWVLFLPENESHETGLLYSYYILRSKGIKVIYLGSRVQLDSLKEVVSVTKATDLFFFLVSNSSQEEISAYLKSVSAVFKKQNIHFSGKKNLIDKVKVPLNCEYIKTPQDLINKL